MGTIQQIQRWSVMHHPRWLVILRIALGICLFAKGISFMTNVPLVEQQIKGTFLSPYSSWLAIVVTWAHLLGGFFIIIGLRTRWAVLSQIPILVGAIVLVNLKQGSGQGSELLFSIIIFLMLIFFLVEGSGRISLDYMFKNYQL
jgi:putative oxidoreductase